MILMIDGLSMDNHDNPDDYTKIIPWLYHDNPDDYTMIIPRLYHDYTKIIPWLYHVPL